MVGVRRFELPAPASRRQCSTRLSYTPCLCRHAAGEAAYSIEGMPIWKAQASNLALLMWIFPNAWKVEKNNNFY